MKRDRIRPVPFPGQSWYEGSQPICQPHEYVRNGTAKLLTLFEPANGQRRVKGVTSTTNAVLHPWMKQQLNAILETLPPASPVEDDAANLLLWQRGLRWPLGLGEKRKVSRRSWTRSCPASGVILPWF